MKRIVKIEKLIEVEIDESKFTEEFINDFKESFYPFENMDAHITHIAWLESSRLLNSFTEGYGDISDFGISAQEKSGCNSIET